MRGQIGRSYKLNIALTDGKGHTTSTYESDWLRLNEPPTIDSVYAETGQTQTLVQDMDGTYHVSTQLGLNKYIDATPPANQDYYYKFKSSMIDEVEQTIWPYGKLPNNYYYVSYSWSISDLDIKNDLKASTAENLTPLKKVFVGFIPKFFSAYYDSFSDPANWDGAITLTEIYSVPKKIYEIFTQENAQTKPSNSLFDPIPTQIVSNIKCTSNPSVTVLGYFATASVIRKYHYFYYSNRVYSKELDSIPKVFIPDSSPDSAITPNFWVFP